VIDAATAVSLSPEENRRAFTVVMATLLAEFNAYLDRDGADPVADAVGFRQHALWLSPDELTEMTRSRGAMAYQGQEWLSLFLRGGPSSSPVPAWRHQRITRRPAMRTAHA
jgi:hypothetical protein